MAVVLRDGKSLALDRSLGVRNHSPTGFEWGYGGSGPAQLALALLLDAGVNEALAVGLHQSFKAQVVALWPQRAPWTTTDRAIWKWVRARAKEGKGGA